MEEKCKQIVEILKSQNRTISFMESCTGGFLANEITNISGASDVLKVSLVTYSNEYKIKFNVDKNVINNYTVYSTETAREMAEKVAKFAGSNIGVGITGELGNTINKEPKVYYTIYCSEQKEFLDKVITVKEDKRANMKKQVAEKVLSDILEQLSK